MNFDLSPDERALQDAIRELCARRFAPADLRAEGMSAGRWGALEEAGVFTLRVPEDDGGLGLGMTHAVVAFEDLGRALVPGPIVETHVARAHGVPAPTSGLIERAAPTIDHFEHLLAIVVLDAGGAARLEPSDVEVEPVEAPLDPFTPAHRIVSLGDGERVGGPDVASRMRAEATMLTAAMLTGIAAATTDAAVAYAKEREQFGKPIGAFQAVKHLCADMYVRMEVARAAVYAAACVLDDPAGDDGARAVAGAKLLAGEAAVANGKTSIQVHGGMGFTWEVDQHLYLKRAAVLRNAFGGTHAHEEAMAACL